MTLSNDVSRCTGLFVGVHGEFARMLHEHCFDCARRTQLEHGALYPWMEAPDFKNTCESKINQEGN